MPISYITEKDVLTWCHHCFHQLIHYKVKGSTPRKLGSQSIQSGSTGHKNMVHGKQEAVVVATTEKNGDVKLLPLEER